MNSSSDVFVFFVDQSGKVYFNFFLNQILNLIFVSFKMIDSDKDVFVKSISPESCIK